ncbi:MAG: DedA family protein [Deltaproteobacteria bacterium]|nr:DedA family protein [Deltaproteobacteria bacterium]
MTEWLAERIELIASQAPTWGYLWIVLFMTIESSFIPFPSEVVMIPAGFLAARGELSFGSPILDALLSIVAGTIGSLLGAYFNYAIAAKLGEPFLRKHAKWFFLKEEHIDRAQFIFRKYGAGATFVCRLLPAIRQIISIPAGLARMPIGSFSLWTGLGAGIWVTVLTVVGYSFGLGTADLSYRELVEQASHAIRKHWIYVIPVLLIGFALYVGISKRIMGAGSKGDTSTQAPA